jgi:S1-C subfamily serine protease
MRLEIRSGAGAGTAVEVDQERYVIGREEGCDLVLGDDAEASRRHAEIRRSGDAWEIEDLGSRNGTFVDGTRIEASTALTDGSEVKIGQTTLGVSVTAPAPSEAAAPPERGQSRIRAATSSIRARMPGGRRDDSVDRRVQSAVRRALADQQSSMRRLTVLAGGAVVIAVVAVVLLVTGVFSGSSSTPTAAEVVNKVRPSVVYVLASKDGLPRASGTGWVYDAGQGLIVTNAHVIGAGDSVSVQVGGDTRDATVVGASPCFDLAVLKVTDTSGLVTLPLGSQSDLQQGDTVFAIGYPGNFSTTPQLQVTSGIVSSVEESADLGPSSGDPDLQTYPNVIQTDAAINHGNSGGPLVDDAEEVVGVNTLSDPESQNQGYAIGADLVKEKVPQLASGQSIGWAGFDFTAQGHGLVVTTAIQGTSAAENGLGQQPIVLTEVNGHPVGTRNDYCKAVEGTQSGQQIQVRGFYKSGLPFEATLTLE